MRSSFFSAAKPVLLPALALGGYVALIAWFRHDDFYNVHFFDSGWIVARYNLTRVLFIAALAWLVYAAGAGMLRLVAGREAFCALPAAERYALGFFTGSGLWHVGLFGIGLAGLYTRPMAVIVTVAAMALSLPHLAACAAEARRRLPPLLDPRQPRGRNKALWLAALAGTGAVFVAVKGLYPAGGHDYYTHYFYYYMSVIRHASILPNEVWYQFFYSKGAGLYFLAMLLTDPLAPQLVATAFIAAGALTVAALLQRAAPGSRIPWLGAILYIALLIYTPGPPDNLREGGWGDLEKIHEINAVTVLGLFWIATRLGAPEPGRRRLWLTGLVAAAVTSVLLTTVMVAIVGGFLAALTVFGAATRNWRLAADGVCGGAAAGATFAVVLAVNYALTGMPLDQGLLYSWPILDLAKVDRWGVVSEVLWLHYGLTALAARGSPLDIDSARLLFNSLRLDIWWPLALVAMAAGWWRWFTGRWGPLLAQPGYRAGLRSTILFAAMFVAVFLAAADSRAQAVSFYRFSSINYGPTLCGLLLLCMALPPSPRFRAAVGGAVVAGLAAIVVIAAGPHGEQVFGRTPRVFDGIANYVPRIASSAKAIVVHAAYFARGRFSIETAYRAQEPWPGRLPWGGIYPAMETVWRIVGRGTPVYSLHMHSYCMLPDCRVLTWMSTRATPDTDVVLLGTAAEATAALKRAGINYFFYSKELGVPGLGIGSPLPRSPVLAPDTIADNLGIKWTDGTSYLLTWRDAAERPLDAGFLATYREQVDAAPTVIGFPLQLWAAVYAHFRAKGLHPFRLPWCVTCGHMPDD